MNTGNEWWEMRNRKDMGRTELEAIERLATRATSIAPLSFIRTSIASADAEISRMDVRGTTEAYAAARSLNLAAGRFLSGPDEELARSVAVLGPTVSDRLFPGVPLEAVPGRRVRIKDHPFTVVGVLERRGRMLGQDLDNDVTVPFSTFVRDMGSKRSINIAVTGEPGQVEALEEQLTGILRQARKVPPEKKDDFAINRQDQLLKVYNQLTGALYGVAVGVGLITLIVGGIGIMNIMLVSVTERTREIGVRRALGARKRTILLQFLIESSAVAALGGAIGTGLGLGVAVLVSELSPLAAAVTPSAIALGLGFSSVVGLLFGIWPAWRAANLDPVEALRYE